MAGQENVKRADKPDSGHCGCPQRDRHYSGPGVAHPARCYLPANSPCGATRSREVALLPWLAYLVLLRVEIARFTQVAFRALGGYGASGLRLSVWLAPAGASLRWPPIEHPWWLRKRPDSSLLL